MTKKKLVFDIETNGLLDTMDTIHCLVIKDTETKEIQSFRPHQVEVGLKILSQADLLIGHNIIKFDIPAIKLVYPNWETKADLMDTIVASRLIWADIKDLDFRKISIDKSFPSKMIGKHSLEAWGHRLDFHKGDFGQTTDWSQWSEEMQTYCERDVDLNYILYEKICSKKYSEESLRLEHEFQKCILQQEENGFMFDIPAAEKLTQQLQARRSELNDELQKIFPPYEKDDGVFIPKRDNATRGYKAGVPIHRKKTIIFNPNSNDHITDVLLLKYKWKPKDFTDNGKPKLDETILGSLPYPEAKPLTEYKLITKRLGQLAEGNNAWLKLVKGTRIYGSVITNGAVTGRCTHRNPNIAQVPSVNVPYGKECRSLFISPPEHKLVGVDVAGLELRCLAHYLHPFDKGKMVDEILNGDIHSSNQEAAGLPTRNQAKTLIYAFIYSAGDKKLGEIVNGTAKDGKDLRQKFLSRNPALGMLKQDVEARAKHQGFLRGIDGRQLKVRSLHSSFNTLLQSCGAIIVKKATVLLNSRILWEQWTKDVQMVAHIHDEIQLQVKNKLVDDVGKAAVKAIKEVQYVYNLNCPLDGEYKVGSTWADTH